MKDMGLIQGSAAQALPLVVGIDTVYIHTEIERLPDDEERGGELYQYREIQYDKDEYIKLMSEKNSELESLVNIVLGVTDDE